MQIDTPHQLSQLVDSADEAISVPSVKKCSSYKKISTCPTVLVLSILGHLPFRLLLKNCNRPRQSVDSRSFLFDLCSIKEARVVAHARPHDALRVDALFLELTQVP